MVPAYMVGTTSYLPTFPAQLWQHRRVVVREADNDQQCVTLSKS